MAALLWVGGWNVAREAQASGALAECWVEDACLGEATAAGLPAKPLDREALRRRFGPEARQGVVSGIQLPPPTDPDVLLELALAAGRPLVAFEEVQDPQNVGSALRACAALGAAGFVRTRHRSAPWSAAVLRASVGLALRVPWAEVGGMPNWLQRRPRELSAWAAAAGSGARPDQRPLVGAAVLLFGAEGAGLRPLTAARCDGIVSIPSEPGVDSLNVAQAATVLLYEAARQRLSANDV